MPECSIGASLKWLCGEICHPLCRRASGKVKEVESK